MRSIILVIVILVAAVTCAAQPGEQRRFGIPPMRGPVRSVRVEKAQIVNRNGDYVEGPRVLLQTYNYSEDSTRKELTMYNADGSVSGRTVEVYDTDGKILAAQAFDSGGNVGNRMVYKYDTSQRPTERIVYRPDGSIAGKLTYTYADKKRFHESVNYDQNGVVISRVTGTLDLTTHQIETVTQTPKETVQREAGFTDIPNGQIYEERVNGVSVNRSLTSGSGDNGVEVTRFNPDGSVQSKYRSKAEFDSHQNGIRWVSLRALPGNKFEPVEVFYRTIEYYETRPSGR